MSLCFAFWAAAPIGDEVLYNGEKFRPSIRPSVRLYIHPPRGLSQAQGGPSQLLGGPSQALEDQIQALGGPSQALGGQS